MAETTEQAPAPKKTTRKPDPLTRAVADMKEVGKHLGECTVKDVPADRAAHYDQRAAAWGRAYAERGGFDDLVLSLAYEALAGLNPAEQRYSLLQLSAVALGRAAELDGRA
ncbi:hypothetical protein KGG77_gp41 [Streptomyces phage Omar]|uniref:Uncharacterized protein n=1 Tax=Streptomyces phage Omar TaxID=2059882 RepID=A0A2H5BLN8_9CAUD|nr:hypothetical protein KGG77_gp41 [Streptomyces phage Omar]AUG87227.1 hypothetical protein SEA_OMAR_43 [Streptomyces phage Omar]